MATHSQDDDNDDFFQAIFGLDSHKEPSSDNTTDVSSPNDTGSCKSDVCKSSGTLALVTQSRGPPALPSVVQQAPAPAPCEHAAPLEDEQKQPPTSSTRRFANVGVSPSSAGRMRNLAIFSTSAISAAASQLPDTTSSAVQKSQKRDQSRLDARLEKSTYRASRYLYDVPTSSSFGDSPAQGARNGFSWSQFISQSVPRRVNGTARSIFDQHKIYDIYEESIWHTAHTTSNTNPPHSASNKASALSQPGSHDGKSAEDEPHSESKKFESLRRIKRAASSWRLIRSLKPKPSSPRRKESEWECASLFSSSDYSDDDYSEGPAYSSSSSSHKQSPQKSGSSKQGVHSAFKRAGLEFIRRSASFCKSVSSSARFKNHSSLDAELSPCNESHSSFESPSESPDKAKAKHPKGRRLANAMRQAGHALRGSLLPKAGKGWGRISGDARPSPDPIDTFSMYPCDLAHHNIGDSDISSSIFYSPVVPVPVSSGTGGHETFAGPAYRGAEPGVNGYVGAENNSRYFLPPKRPPILGLRHNASAGVFGAEPGSRQDTGGVQEQGPAPSSIPLLRASSALSQMGSEDARAATAKTRTTSFNSPFTTLPYGSYAQMRQQQLQQLGGQHSPIIA
ncbi:hypothetical protein GGI12_000208 [Dipsacomyces acuminosporus]|nr:hypothetical protein GGI12_000208 [Dipsacomyces acuminosporus]